MPSRPVAVSWEVAHDERFTRLVRRGMTMARREDAHTVHVDVGGLEPARWYYYRFRAEGQLSPVGRTRTAPAPGDLPSSWTFSIASCQNYTAGYYTAYQDMLAGNPDLVVHLGDYIYEGGAQGAYWEHMPFRTAQRPAGPTMTLYRRLHWGRLATINMLDTRQYRSDHVPDIEADGPAAWDPDRTMLGTEQMRWLVDDLNTSTSTWNVLAQQVPFFEDPDVGAENDKWDGYRVSRQQLLEVMASGRPRNPLVLSGDIHANRAADLKLDFDDPESVTVGVEFTGTSITSGGQAAATVRHDPDPDNPHFRMAGTGRGHVAITVTRNNFV